MFMQMVTAAMKLKDAYDSVRKVPRVVTGESGIVLCGGMELRFQFWLIL